MVPPSEPTSRTHVLHPPHPTHTGRDRPACTCIIHMHGAFSWSIHFHTEYYTRIHVQTDLSQNDWIRFPWCPLVCQSKFCIFLPSPAALPCYDRFDDSCGLSHILLDPQALSRQSIIAYPPIFLQPLCNLPMQAEMWKSRGENITREPGIPCLGVVSLPCICYVA